MKHHSYTGPPKYLNIHSVMQKVNAAHVNNGNYQKYVDTAGGSTVNITAEEIAALYSNVLATQTIMSGKRSGGGSTAKKSSNGEKSLY